MKSKSCSLQMRAILFGAFLLCLTSVSYGHESDDMFIMIGAVESLNYPEGPAELNKYRRTNNQKSLRVYEKVKKGKTLLLQEGRKKGLELTLNALKSYCPENNDEQPDFYRCSGATYALYFFPSETADKQILDFFKKSDPKLVRSIFSRIGHSEWMYNRPDQKKWITYIENLKGFTEKEKLEYKSAFLAQWSECSSVMELIEFPYLPDTAYPCGAFDDKAIFLKLSYINSAEFPKTLKALNHCREKKTQPSLQVFEAVKKAKACLLSQGEKALQITLDTINRYCATADGRVSPHCLGAVNALYFFSTKEQDDAMLEFFLNSDRKVVDTVFSIKGSQWVYNRHDPQKWCAFADAVKGLANDRHCKFSTNHPVCMSMDLLGN